MRAGVALTSAGKLQFTINTGFHTSDCCEFNRRFSLTGFDRAANLEPILPDARLDHLEAKFDAFVVHWALSSPKS